MNFFETLTSNKTALWGSLILSAVIIYPNIGDFIWSTIAPPDRKHHDVWNLLTIIYFVYRYLFFVALTYSLIKVNINDASTKGLNERFFKSFLITMFAYAIYVLIGLSVEYAVRLDCFTQTVILQFLIAWLVPVLIGHAYYLTVIQRETEKEMERLRTENLQSRVEALSNQINPHFFFNSLNGLTALVSAKRNEESVEYASKMSNMFRYILQSDKKGLVRLEEELRFVDAYRYLIEVRYSGKMCFKIEVNEEDLSLQLPVLSLLPLIENIVKHNIIDSEHKMAVHIYVSGNKELIVSNPIYRKLNVEGSNQIGLSNLSSRYKLLMGNDIKVIDDDNCYTVVLPLKKSDNESTDC